MWMATTVHLSRNGDHDQGEGFAPHRVAGFAIQLAYWLADRWPGRFQHLMPAPPASGRSGFCRGTVSFSKGCWGLRTCGGLCCCPRTAAHVAGHARCGFRSHRADFDASAGSSGLAILGAASFGDDDYLRQLHWPLEFVDAYLWQRRPVRCAPAIKWVMPCCFMPQVQASLLAQNGDQA